jgi:cytidine deaminase
LRSGSGVIHSGANVENASFGLTRCAEQSAIQALVSSGETDFTEIVVFTEASRPASPCGACRQILFEFSPSASVVLVNDEGTVIRHSVSSLLPDGFSLTPPA